ncbi:shikimate dehydrogenase [Streptomyces sp. 8N114]|uniref:shikimate dehydrogenase n=1 Tax=Streptomyces sp. 8N114 TaxID=3457419 RepID=UPI003FD344F3
MRGAPDGMQACAYGLIGAGIGTSLSPALHQEEGRHHGLGLSYVLIDTARPGTPDELGGLLRDAEAQGFAGLNITHPYKQRVIPELDELSPLARAIGAVNTVVFRDGRRIGHNTDASGFARSFRRGLPGAATRRVVQFGAGGAGAAVAHAQLAAGTGHVAIMDPDPSRSAALVRALRKAFGDERADAVDPDGLPASLTEADGVVNASPVGMISHPGTPVAVELLRDDQWVADVVYMPTETRLLSEAAARGLRTLGGTGMCVFQAAGAFELITGRTPDTERMLRHLSRLLAQREAATPA